MKKEINWKKLCIILGVLLIISLISILFFKESILSPNFKDKTFTWKEDKIPMSFESLGTCLAYVNATMYGAEWCQYCKSQKEILGEEFNKINYVECWNETTDTQTDFCTNKGIRAYPTWEINGELYEGVKTIKQLKDLTGC